MTPAQRKKINRQNAQNSTGPRTEAGKDVARRNATTHGLRARILPLPGEDPDHVAEHQDSWNDHHQPATPAEQHLVNECAAASLQFDRCNRYHHAVISQQVRAARDNYEAQQIDELERLNALLSTEPAAAVRGLKRSALGCRWLIDRWSELQERFLICNTWCDADRDQALRLSGIVPQYEEMHNHPDIYMSWLYNALAPEAGRDEDRLRWLLDPETMPDALKPVLANGVPKSSFAQRKLLGKVEAEIAVLEEIEAALQPRDEADRAEAGERALLIADDRTARLYLRYQSEARTAFHRAYAALVKAQNDRVSAAEIESSPNEANPVADPLQGTCPEATCVEPSGAEPKAATAETGPEPAAAPTATAAPDRLPPIAAENDGLPDPVAPIATTIPPPVPT